MSKPIEGWGSRIGLILAMAGNAVGLGNFLRFPIQAVENGGGAFIIPYLTCFLLMGVPLLLIEWSTGRFAGQFGDHSTPFLMQQLDPKRHFWKYLGVFGIFANVAVAAYYCYVESWTMAYVYHSAVGTFGSMSQVEVANFFTAYTDINQTTSGIPYENIVFFVFCVLLNTWILSKGLAGGVEVTAKIGMPLLILFGIFLAIQGVSLTAGENGAQFDGTVGLDFLWTPQFDSLTNPSVWLAAAGQIFFTLSVGMGTVICFASYIKKRRDVALNAMTAGWLNEFVEVVLGASILIPICVGYFGVDKVVELVKSGGGFGLAFQSLPYLFQQWGGVMAVLAGVSFFGLLFFAGITSSLAMGTPWIGLLRYEFGWSEKRAAWSFGGLVLLLGLPTVLFYDKGVFGEYDYWAGTVCLFFFAMVESILFAWVFGIDRGWAEINDGAEIRLPSVYKFVLKYITPALLLFVFVGNLFIPAGADWGAAISNLVAGNGWQFDASSLVGTVSNAGLKAQIAAAQVAGDSGTVATLQERLFYVNGARLLLLATFLFITALVYLAYRKRLHAGRVQA
ncbi:sodium-dependent transporter [Permianibacter sp. IMCC34836]|uniref:sodium-dependent transporter n=1 Tax=Permianibacter fluminis TaxID=2738515 RepID=UPI001551B1AE|nr:sodium-dependent transporter [Permianibacter fluminis]NQD38115.1 sodium-dependent transporter [Permianibacter fluminis]